ncbi:MAG: aldo/keto reductase [Pseudomonadota bacterium]
MTTTPERVDPNDVPSCQLPSGTAMPVLGLGTWQLTGPRGADLVMRAAELGYRSFDTAAEYGNEAEVGAGLARSGVPRSACFVTTKVWYECVRAGELEDNARRSLDRLRTDWIDLLLIHWPNANVPLAETIAALDRVVDAGVTRAIGVSNFPAGLLLQAMSLSRHPLATNQVEYHPALDQSRLLAILREHGMVLTAHTPLGMGRGLDDDLVHAIARDHGATPAQVVLRWLIQQDSVVAVPRTSNPARLHENLAAVRLTLTDDEMARIDALRRPDGRIVNPSFAPDWNA